MTYLLIFIMIAFVGGSALQQILKSMGGTNKALAYYGDGKKITPMTQHQAQAELDLLKNLMADRYLMSNPTIMGRSDYRSVVLAQILFDQPGMKEGLNAEFKQSIAQGSQMTVEDIDDFFAKAGGRSDLYWIPLKEEAREAGCVVSNETAKEALKRIIPAMTNQQITAGKLIDTIVERSSIPEERIIGIFAELLSVMTYGNIITRSENVTIDEVRTVLGRSGEKINAEYVRIGANDFADTQAEPTAQELAEQFEAYKRMTASYVSDENPYGFGYKLPARVRLEYLVVKLDDIKETIEEPTHEEMGDYYRQNTHEFTYSAPADPADPTAEKEEKVRSYAEVASRIKGTLKRNKMNSKADMIIGDALDMTSVDDYTPRDVTEYKYGIIADNPLMLTAANMFMMTFPTEEEIKSRLGDNEGYRIVEMAKATEEEIKLLQESENKRFTEDYGKTADDLTAKYGIKVYAGSTGLLSAEDLASDRVLGNMMVDGDRSEGTRLTRMVFAVEELGITKLGPFESRAPKMWANIGPIKDGFAHVALIRIIETAKEAVADNIDLSSSIKGVDLTGEAEEVVFSVKEQVATDVKLLKAMDAAKARAEELAKLAAEKDFEEAIAEINKKYAVEGDAAAKKLVSQKMSNRIRQSQSDLADAYTSAMRNPGRASSILKSQQVAGRLVESINNLIPEGQLEATGINKVMQFESDASYYVVKDVSRTAMSIQDYEKQKGPYSYVLDLYAGEAMALHHYRPDNLLKRMNFQPVERDEDEEADGSEETDK